MMKTIQLFLKEKPVLQSLLDKLLEIQVITDPEWESVDEMQNKRDKVRFVIDTVRKKGEAASSEMIEFLCEADPFLCEHLGLGDTASLRWYKYQSKTTCSHKHLI
uniref:CARD domain-containing protein n=1 Tax=Seriola dumerili TaxID=41447 RepID=A0A3B4VNY5_SERDU